jgi:hypothetical protein
VPTRTPRVDATATLVEFFPDEPTTTPGGEEDDPTPTPRRRATSTPGVEPTEEATEEPTELPVDEPTATPEEEPTAGSIGSYELYSAAAGDWSIEHPDSWVFDEDPPYFHWFEPGTNSEAFIQVT